MLGPPELSDTVPINLTSLPPIDSTLIAFSARSATSASVPARLIAMPEGCLPSSMQPGGGTDFKDALEIAEREILQSGIPVRQVILLTDGDTNRQYHDHDDLIAEFARQHIPVSTIRIGPDLANLELLQDFAQATGGIFYRVQDIEKLPLLLVGLTREAMNRRKSDRTTVEAGEASAMLSEVGMPCLKMKYQQPCHCLL